MSNCDFRLYNQKLSGNAGEFKLIWNFTNVIL